jgi:DNA-binding PadR family transcriptional regulator
MKLRPISFLILGMVRVGATSGYAIKKAAETGTRIVWPVSLAQVYPELAKLEEHGYLTRTEDPHGDRARSTYALTDAGREALVAWLRSPIEPPPHFRSEGMLRAFFADALPKEDQIELLRRQRERLTEVKAWLNAGDLRRAAKEIDAGLMRFPVLLGAYGDDVLDFTLDWIRRVEGELEEELNPQPGR